MSFTPPFPPRHRGEIAVTELLSKAARSLLEVWGEEMFRNSGTVMDLLGHRLMVFSQPAAVEAVLVTQAGNFAAKPPQLRKLLTPLMGEGLFAAEGAGWRARRPPVAAACCPALSLGEAIQAASMHWAARPDGATIELISEMEHCAAALLGRMLFGPVADRPATTGLARLAAAYRGKISGAGLITLIALPEPLARMRLAGDAKRIQAAVNPLVERAARDPGSLMGQLAAAPGMTSALLQQEAMSLLGMGQDALAGLLSVVWFLLAQAPEAEAALHTELATVLGGRAAAMPDLGRLPMTRAVLQEALRLYPPVPLLMRVAARATEVTGLPVPAGSIACIAPWLLQRHESHWEAPDEFRPERFLPDAPAPTPYTYLPFGQGSRLCPGQEMAMHLAMLLMATLAQRFRLRALPGHRPVPRAGLTFSLAARLPMRLERR